MKIYDSMRVRDDLRETGDNVFWVREKDAVELAQRCEILEQEARVHAQEARTQRATVQAIYQLVSGKKGEPGDWNGAEPVRMLVEQRDRLQEALEATTECLECNGFRNAHVVIEARAALKETSNE